MNKELKLHEKLQKTINTHLKKDFLQFGSYVKYLADGTNGEIWVDAVVIDTHGGTQIADTGDYDDFVCIVKSDYEGDLNIGEFHDIEEECIALGPQITFESLIDYLNDFYNVSLSATIWPHCFNVFLKDKQTNKDTGQIQWEMGKPLEKQEKDTIQDIHLIIKK